MKAIIGGTGIDKLDMRLIEKNVLTEFGVINAFMDDDIVFIPRHGVNHDLPPHLVNYKGNIRSLKNLGVDECICIYAVGSISDHLRPGEADIVADLLDFTGGGRLQTFHTGFSYGVRHVDCTDLFSQSLIDRALREARNMNMNLSSGGIYCCTNGPRLETRAEIRAYGMLGADYVGMTACPEIFLLKEAGIDCMAIAYSINWAAGVHDENMNFISDEEVEKKSEQLTLLAKNILA